MRVLSGLSGCCVEWVTLICHVDVSTRSFFLFMKSMRICYVPMYYLTLHATCIPIIYLY